MILLLLKNIELALSFLFKQNCEKIENNKDPFLKKNAEFRDQGYYTCVFFLPHNGKLFNVTKTFKITVIKGKRNFRIRRNQCILV